MKVLDGPWPEWRAPDMPTSMTIGVLDGVHRGHRALLSRLEETMTRVVLTFDPHPVEVLRPGTSPQLLTTIEERIALLDQAGVDCVGVLDLADIKEQSPRRFVADVLVAKVGVGQLVIGQDFRFGKDRSGDVALLRDLGSEHGFEVVSIELVAADGAPVSSSRIRSLIEAGGVAEASALLGSRFSLTNTVIDGDKRGREIGFPTANLRPPDRKIIPAHGVYACLATIGGETHHAAVNVGVRPTFGGNELLIEAHVLDFERDIYGRELTLEFVEYLRPELAFSGVDPLVDQMIQDIAQSRAILESAPSRM